MLWIAVTLPDLPLEAVRPPLPSPLPLPSPIESGTGAAEQPLGLAREALAASAIALVRQHRVLLVDAIAAAAGVRAGMSRAQAQALLPALRVLAPDPAKVDAVLRGVALALLRYTPRVVLAEAHTILVEVSASLRLFGGLRALWCALSATVHAAGYRAVLACAPTPRGSWLLARQRAVQDETSTRGRRFRVLRAATLARQLDRLPLGLLPAATEHERAFEQMGCDTLAALRALPTAGIARRFGTGILQQLAQAYGEAPDPRTLFEAPARFAARLDLQARVSDTEALLGAARHLLAQLAGWLTVRHAALRAYTLVLVHETARGGAPESSTLPVAWAVPSRDPAQWAWLLRETFARTRLRAPVLELRLQADEIEAYVPVAQSLFAAPGAAAGTAAAQDSGIVQLAERLAARLGGTQVCMPVPQADHRPEAAAGQAAPAVVPSRTARKTRRASRIGMQARASLAGDGQVAAPQALRPFWLLDTPQGLAAGAIHFDHADAPRPANGWGGGWHVLQGPERIESGWWDGAGATRDYFVARAAQGELGWIYRDCGSGRWFLHGWFA